jgi:hypothetical protein
MRYTILLLILWISASASAANVEVHQHSAKEIDYNTPIPKVYLNAFKDALDGINVQIMTEDYVLNAPLDEDMCNQPTVNSVLQGHAHLFVNGIKRQRVYGKLIHVPKSWLRDGINQIAVSLNSHRHENWVVNGQTIVSSLFVDIEQEPLIIHSFSSRPEHTAKIL